MIPKGHPKLMRWLRDELQIIEGMTDRVRALIGEMVTELLALGGRIDRLDSEFDARSMSDLAACGCALSPGSAL